MYELMIILKPLLPDDVRKAIHKNIVNTIADMGGEVKDVDVWGKRYLSYKIKTYSEGYYIVYQYDMPANQIAEFTRQMGLKQEIIRFLTSTLEKPELITQELEEERN
jgi:small subunit ribosomal protein S6